MNYELWINVLFSSFNKWNLTLRVIHNLKKEEGKNDIKKKKEERKKKKEETHTTQHNTKHNKA